HWPRLNLTIPRIAAAIGESATNSSTICSQKPNCLSSDSKLLPPTIHGRSKHGLRKPSVKHGRRRGRGVAFTVRRSGALTINPTSNSNPFRPLCPLRYNGWVSCFFARIFPEIALLPLTFVLVLAVVLVLEWRS